MRFSMDDEALMQMSSMNEKYTHYRRYITNRFMVMDVFEDSVVIADKEMGLTSEYREGDQLADGRISSLSEEGIVFQPPRADQCPFTLAMRSEMYPIAGQRATKDRLRIEDEIKMRYDTQGPIIITIDPDDMR